MLVIVLNTFLLKLAEKYKDVINSNLMFPLLMPLIAKKQFNKLDKIFGKYSSIKDKVMVIYYLNLKLMGEKVKLAQIPIELRDNDFLDKDLSFYQNYYSETINNLKNILEKRYKSKFEFYK